MEMKEILKEERKKRKLTQEDIAKILNISRASYTLYETGKNTPTLENIKILADYYNVPIDYLVGR
jgi:transcriptional regulator with XRE-family HTH domain